MMLLYPHVSFFFFNDTATTEIYTLSLHDALPISAPRTQEADDRLEGGGLPGTVGADDADDLPDPDAQGDAVEDVDLAVAADERSEEHTSELQSPCNLVCRLLLEKKKKRK